MYCHSCWFYAVCHFWYLAQSMFNMHADVKPLYSSWCQRTTEVELKGAWWHTVGSLTQMLIPLCSILSVTISPFFQTIFTWCFVLCQMGGVYFIIPDVSSVNRYVTKIIPDRMRRRLVGPPIRMHTVRLVGRWCAIRDSYIRSGPGGASSPISDHLRWIAFTLWIVNRDFILSILITDIRSDINDIKNAVKAL